MIPSIQTIRDFLEGYGLSEKAYLNKTGTWLASSAIVSGIDTSSLYVGMPVSGSGIPALTRILSIDINDPVNGQITLDVEATAPGTNAILKFEYYTCGVSDAWIENTRDKFVVPWMESKLGMSLSAVQEITEYYDGTGHPIMVLRRRPIVDLVYIGYSNVDTNFYYLTPSALVIMRDEGILKAKANFNEANYVPIFYRGNRNIKITYHVGFADLPGPLEMAVTKLTCEKILGHIANMTGGGDLSMNSYSRSYGGRGRYTNYRNELARDAMAIMQDYFPGAS